MLHICRNNVRYRVNINIYYILKRDNSKKKKNRTLHEKRSVIKRKVI